MADRNSDRSRDRDDRGSDRGERTERRSSRDDDRGGRERTSSRESSRDSGRDRDRGSRDDDRGSSRGRDRDSRDDRGGRDRDRDDRGSSRGSGSSSGYTYERRDDNESRDRANKGAKDFDKVLKDGIKMYKVSEGDNCIRILPPTWKGAKHFGLDVHVHYGVGPDRNSYLDLDKMLGKPDPITEERVLAQRDGDEKYAKELDSKRRVLVYLVDRKNEREGVQAWMMPWTVDRDIIKASQDKKTREVLPIDDPEDGYDIDFEKKGTGDRTEYLAVLPARRSSPLGDKAWLDFAIDNPLPEQLNYFDYDHIAKVFGGGAPAKDSGRDDDRSRDSRDDHSRDRDDRGGRDRGSSREESKPSFTWDSIHDMTPRELEDLIDDQKLDIDPKEAKDDADLADWICEEMKIEKAAPREERGRERSSSRDDGESTEDRLKRLRGRRD